MRLEKPLWIERLGAIAFAVVFGVMAYVALAEREISVGGRAGVAHFEGAAAVRVGFLFLAVTMGAVGYLAKGHRFRAWIWIGLGVAWSGAVATYIVTR